MFRVFIQKLIFSRIVFLLETRNKYSRVIILPFTVHLSFFCFVVPGLLLGQRGWWPSWARRQQLPRRANTSARTSGQDSGIHCLWVHLQCCHHQPGRAVHLGSWQLWPAWSWFLWWPQCAYSGHCSQGCVEHSSEMFWLQSLNSDPWQLFYCSCISSLLLQTCCWLEKCPLVFPLSLTSLTQHLHRGCRSSSID